MPVICPFATYQPAANHSGEMSAHRGLCVHVQVGTGSCYPEFNNPASQASSTWQAMKNGGLLQFVDADLIAWTEMAGNAFYDSVETEGTPDEPLTPEQCATLARLIAWGHATFGWPLQLVDHGASGITTHAHYPSGAPDPAWGNHPCVPLDITEVLTHQGWKHLADIKDEPVASWSPDSGIIRFERPLAITSPYLADTLQCAHIEATGDHRIYTRYRLDRPYKAVALADLKVNARIPQSGHAATSGISVSDDLLRLLVWVQADGHYMKSQRGTLEGVEFHFRKTRKVERVEAVLHSLDQSPAVRTRADGSVVIRLYGVEWIRANVLSHLPEKRWTWDFLNMSGAQWRLFLSELMLADGCQASNIYRSADLQNLDIVQALAHLHGHRASRDGTNGLKITSGRSGQDAAICLYGQSEQERIDGQSPRPVRPGRRQVLVGCLTTVDDTILIRQNGNVSIIGNCPGAIRSAQLPAIVAAAQRLAGQPSPASDQGEDDMYIIACDGQPTFLVLGGLCVQIPDAADLSTWEAQGAKIVRVDAAQSQLFAKKAA